MRLLAILSTSICTGESDAGKCLQLLIFVGRRDDHLYLDRDTYDLDRRASAGVEIAEDVAEDLAHSKFAQNILTSVAGGAAGTVAGHFTEKLLNHTR